MIDKMFNIFGKASSSIGRGARSIGNTFDDFILDAGGREIGNAKRAASASSPKHVSKPVAKIQEQISKNGIQPDFLVGSSGVASRPFYPMTPYSSKDALKSAVSSNIVKQNNALAKSHFSARNSLFEHVSRGAMFGGMTGAAGHFAYSGADSVVKGDSQPNRSLFSNVVRGAVIGAAAKGGSKYLNNFGMKGAYKSIPGANFKSSFNPTKYAMPGAEFLHNKLPTSITRNITNMGQFLPGPKMTTAIAGGAAFFGAGSFSMTKPTNMK